VAVIGHGLWQRRFGADPGVIGEQVAINGRSFTILGVAPATFEGVRAGWLNELWIPTMMLRTGYRWCDGFQRSCPVTSIIARLAPGVSLGEARAEISTLRPSLLEGTDPSDSIQTIVVERADGVPTWEQREYSNLSTLLATIAMVLMAVACANLSGLLLARGIARQREIALRCSLGASQWRIVRQLLTESLIIGVTGSVAGVLASGWTARALVGFFATDSEGYVHPLVVPLDWRVAGFAAATTLIAVILFGLFPATRVSRVDPAETLKSSRG